MSSNPSTSAGTGGPCGACKFLRRKCVAGCIFAPYFDSDQGAARFAAVHKVFGASNVSKLLLHVPVNKRLDAVVTICYEAQARIRDPVYGCVAHLFALQQQVANLQAELSYLQAHLATMEALAPPPPTQPQAPPVGFSIANLPITSCFPSNYDLSVLFDPMMQSSTCPILQPLAQQVDPVEFNGGTTMGIPPQQGANNVSDLHEVARELVQRRVTESTEALTSPSHS
ncbi:LOB domain-containing protein 18-like [Bidens hawaiensis]|uniref:LOB domain-containing protein 18-like n=1 Tax=Bidens hawaiensis TaxID=980011 RepID=UPI00404991C6